MNNCEGMRDSMTIFEVIKKKFLRLSKGQRKVAQYVLANPNQVVASNISDIVRAVGVSQSTVIRFCYALDLPGFVALQNELRKTANELHEIPAPLQAEKASVMW